ncbi:hypothetical protein [Arsukibacterium sp.]|uniref:hypothetical protein n=1 Tax=Arsukibacterium sp. TaxID=1977258 RepID=UPI003566AE0A
MNYQNTRLTLVIAFVFAGVITSEVIAVTPSADNIDSDFKAQVMEGYLQRCVEVLSSKGYTAEAIKAECKCELDQIEQHFSVFSLMLNAATTNTPVTAAEQQPINDLKTRLLQCKNKLAAD